ncbi:MAG: hypothetical protein Hens3KO_14410 [Henriciella sp.]
MDGAQVKRLETYLKAKLNPNLRLVARKETKDSVEVYLDDEFVAVAYEDTDEGEVSYSINMTVLAEDLDL